ncbi:MAG: DUF3189 family protein [Peptococcaceae bacterium]|nr:DUF3189 family protein [Peptococcaceae bacterium]
MKTLIIISSCRFPLSAAAGFILTGRLPDRYAPGKIWEVFSAAALKNCAEGRIYWIGDTAGGTRVAAFTARSGRGILRNLVSSFLDIYQIDQDCCSIVEINTPSSLSFALGQAVLGLPLVCGLGRILVEKHIEKIYPELVRSVQT